MTTPASRRGLKRTCQDNDCGARFYDLNKTTITCPVCGAGFTALPLPKVREVAFKSVSPQRPFVRAFGGLGRPNTPLPARDEDTSDGDENVDEVAEISVEVDDTMADKTESILELDDEVEDGASIVATDKDGQ